MGSSDSVKVRFACVDTLDIGSSGSNCGIISSTTLVKRSMAQSLLSS